MTKRPVGRPSSYRVEFCRAIAEHADILAEGATDSAIATALDVDIRTVQRWCDEFPEFAEACAAIKARANHKVEASLFKRGIGYSHKAVKIFMPAGAVAPVYADYTEHYPPETAAASLWLRNRDPNRWRDRIEHTGAEGGPIEITWQMPAPTEPLRTLPGDTARDVTPAVNARPEPALLDGEAVAVEWGDATEAVAIGRTGQPGKSRQSGPQTHTPVTQPAKRGKP
jgi:hypothetical protein